MISPYQIPSTCSKCGREGVTDADGNAAQWFGGSVAHTDPDVCIYYLKEDLKKVPNG